MKKIKVISLFSGCGGLDLGLEGGFEIKAKFLTNKTWITPSKSAENSDPKCEDFVLLKKTKFQTIFACDIKPAAKKAWEGYFQRKNIYHVASVVDLVKKARKGEKVFPDADVVTGGFPCQDFSLAGKRQGFQSQKTHTNKLAKFDQPSLESRGMLYYWMREVICLVKPKLFLAENVKGLLNLGQVKNIIMQDFQNINGGYTVVDPILLEAANYGVPQKRERVFFIGIRNDAVDPEILKKVINGEIQFSPKKTHDIQNNIFTTVKQAVFDLGEPEASLDLSHQKYSKAKWYGKHCQGQTEIKPLAVAPTIRAEHHGNIEFRRLSQQNGGVIRDEYHLPQRRLSVRECARLQTFPDQYEFVSKKVSASQAYKLIGNAVPPLLGYHLAKKLESLWPVLFPGYQRNTKV